MSNNPFDVDMEEQIRLLNQFEAQKRQQTRPDPSILESGTVVESPNTSSVPVIEINQESGPASIHSSNNSNHSNNNSNSPYTEENPPPAPPRPLSTGPAVPSLTLNTSSSAGYPRGDDEVPDIPPPEYSEVDPLSATHSPNTLSPELPGPQLPPRRSASPSPATHSYHRPANPPPGFSPAVSTNRPPTHPEQHHHYERPPHAPPLHPAQSRENYVRPAAPLPSSPLFDRRTSPSPSPSASTSVFPGNHHATYNSQASNNTWRY